MSDIEREQNCKQCQRKTKQHVGAMIDASGKAKYGWWCPTCSDWSRPISGVSIWIDTDKMLKCGVVLEDIIVVKQIIGERCYRCHVRGAELHHWAPQALFKDANEWPTDYLCPKCHALWHQIMTPPKPS